MFLPKLRLLLRPYNTMIDACAKANDTQRAVKWLQQMKELQLRPMDGLWSIYIYISVIDVRD